MPNNGHYAVQGHSRSPILVPIESYGRTNRQTESVKNTPNCNQLMSLSQLTTTCLNRKRIFHGIEVKQWRLYVRPCAIPEFRFLPLAHCIFFHRRTRSAYVYNGCLAWYNVVLTPRIHSTVKYSQLGQSANICDVSNQPTRPWKQSQWQQTTNKEYNEILTYTSIILM